MRAKSLAILSFLQTILITMAQVVINISLYRTLAWYNAYDYYYDSYWNMDKHPVPLKLQFYLSIQENALTLYLIPIVWFLIILFFNNRPQTSPFINKISFWSAIFIMILFIFVIVDVAYLSETILHERWMYGDDHCSKLDCLLWKYIEQYYSP